MLEAREAEVGDLRRRLQPEQEARKRDERRLASLQRQIQILHDRDDRDARIRDY